MKRIAKFQLSHARGPRSGFASMTWASARHACLGLRRRQKDAQPLLELPLEPMSVSRVVWQPENALIYGGMRDDIYR